MLKAIILHNEPKQWTALKNQFNEHCNQIEIVAETSKEADCLKWINKTQLHLFVVIQGVKAIKNLYSLIEKFRQSGKEVIVIAKAEHLAAKLVGLGIVDFLSLPCRSADLKLAEIRLLVRYNERQQFKQMNLIVNNLPSNHHQQPKLAVPTVEGFVFIKMDDIIRCEANGAYTHIYIGKKEKIVASRNIKEYEELLPKYIFFRIHNSHLVNINRIQKYNKGRGGTVTMEDGSNIEVASRRRTEFLNMFL